MERYIVQDVNERLPGNHFTEPPSTAALRSQQTRDFSPTLIDPQRQDVGPDILEMRRAIGMMHGLTDAIRGEGGILSMALPPP